MNKKPGIQTIMTRKTQLGERLNRSNQPRTTDRTQKLVKEGQQVAQAAGTGQCLGNRGSKQHPKAGTERRPYD